MALGKKQITKKEGRTKWQANMLKLKRCVACGNKATTKKMKNGKKKVLSLCEKHRRERASRAIKRYYETKD